MIEAFALAVMAFTFITAEWLRPRKMNLAYALTATVAIFVTGITGGGIYLLGASAGLLLIAISAYLPDSK